MVDHPEADHPWVTEKLIRESWTAPQSHKSAKVVPGSGLIAAAHGDKDSVIRLPDDLQAFIAIHLDDEQCKFLAAQNVADVIPNLGERDSVWLFESAAG